MLLSLYLLDKFFEKSCINNTRWYISLKVEDRRDLALSGSDVVFPINRWQLKDAAGWMAARSACNLPQ